MTDDYILKVVDINSLILKLLLITQGDNLEVEYKLLFYIERDVIVFLFTISLRAL